MSREVDLSQPPVGKRVPMPVADLSFVSIPMEHTARIAKPSIVKNVEGWLMTRSDASIRYLTWGEGLRYRLFKAVPADIIHPDHWAKD